VGALTVYLDASVLVALFVQDSLKERAMAFLRATHPVLFVSDFASAEFSSAIAHRVRIGAITEAGARAAFTNYDDWTGRMAALLRTESADINAATVFVRRLDLTLRAPDAINIAIARRVGAALATFDRKMAEAAAALGVTVAAA